jgi:hypothetical protein
MTNSNLRAAFLAAALGWLSPIAAVAETPREFAAQCRREVAEIAQKARAALTAGEKAEYCRQAMEKALDCHREGQRRFPDRGNELPPLGQNGYEEGTALNCYLYWTQAKNDLDLNLSWHPAERLRHLRERVQRVDRIAAIAHSAGFDKQMAPTLGKDSGDARDRGGRVDIFGLPLRSVGVRLSRVVAKQCERIVRDFKDLIDKETDPAAKSALRQQLIKAVEWCEKTAHSAGMDERLAPPLGKDAYRIRDYYIDECLDRLARAKTDAEREQIRKECHDHLTNNVRGGRLETPIPVSLTPAGVPPASGRVGDKASGPPSEPTPATTAAGGGCPECESLRARVMAAERALLEAKSKLALAKEDLEKLDNRVDLEKSLREDAKAALDAFDHPGDSAESGGRKIDAVDREIIDDYVLEANIQYRRGDISAAEAEARMKGPSSLELASLRKERRAPLAQDVAESEEEISRLEWGRRKLESALEDARLQVEAAKALLESLQASYADCLADCRKRAHPTRETSVPDGSSEDAGPTLDDIRRARKAYTRVPVLRDPAKDGAPVVDESEDLRGKARAKTGARMLDAETTKPKPEPKPAATAPAAPAAASTAPPAASSTPAAPPPSATAPAPTAATTSAPPPVTTTAPPPSATTTTPPPRPPIETIYREKCAHYVNGRLIYEGDCPR